MALNYNVFPSDLANNPQIGHYVEIKATPARSASQRIASLAAAGSTVIPGLGGIVSTLGGAASDPTQTEYFYMYVPGGGQNTLNWAQQHEYTDVKLARVLAGFVGAGGGAGILPGLMGKAINPQVEVLFRNTQLRTFTFFFLMAPASEDESERMRKIIQRLRYHAAPRILDSTGSLLFEPPSEFQLRFYYREQDTEKFSLNRNLPKIDTCVIERIEVDYTPQGEFSTFSNGHPVSALLSIQFKEISIIDKAKIAGVAGVGSGTAGGVEGGF